MKNLVSSFEHGRRGRGGGEGELIIVTYGHETNIHDARRPTEKEQQHANPLCANNSFCGIKKQSKTKRRRFYYKIQILYARVAKCTVRGPHCQERE